MRYSDLFENDARKEVVRLYNKLPVHWKIENGEAWKSPDLLRKLPTMSDEEVLEVKQAFEDDLAYLKANPKAKLPKPRIGPPKAKRATIVAVTPRVVSMHKFRKWLNDLDPGADPSSYIEDFLHSEEQVEIRDDGLLTFWMLTPIATRIISDLPVALFHFTSSKVARSIRATGLEGDRDPVNGRVQAGVYLTTETSGKAIDGYRYRARAHHGGNPVVVTVKCYLNELERDPDDRGIQSGKTQFIVPHVPTDRIVSITRTI
jgi:hypothetical protein